MCKQSRSHSMKTAAWVSHFSTPRKKTQDVKDTLSNGLPPSTKVEGGSQTRTHVS
jgi:hypothetical protein